MSDRRRNRTALAVLVLVSLLLLTLDYRQGDEGPISALQRAALSVFGPVQEGFSNAVRPIGNVFRSIAELGDLRGQVAKLEAENRDLKESRVSQADLEREVQELRELLRMQQRLRLTTTGARVIAQAPGQFDWRVMIDVGGDHGVRPGMAVFNREGLVGKVVQASGRNAWVELLTNPETTYNVRVTETGEEGWLTGRGSRPFQLRVPTEDADVPEGAEVVTRSAIASTIPDGIPIGVVERVPEEEPAGRFWSVRPYVNFTRLDFVQVILDAPEHPEQLDPDELVPGLDPGRPPPPPADGADEVSPSPTQSPAAETP